jgi:hypothetical protein
MMTITDEQLEERRQWDLRLMRGECTLADCIDICMALGVPGSDYLRQRFNQALIEYSDGQCSDLAEPFGVAMGKREKNAWKRATWISHVRFMVDGEAEKGKPKTDPTYYEDTAFHSAAAMLGKSPHQIFDTYYGKK